MNQINIPIKLRIVHSNNEVINELTQIVKDTGASKVAFISSKTPTHLITNQLETALFNLLEKVTTFQALDTSVASINQIPLENFDLIVGVGGGKIIDVAKYASHINKIPCISIPTSISNDGICSPISVLKGKDNKYQSLGATIPTAMIVPLHLIKSSDPESTLAGIGDLISNLSSVLDCRLAVQVAKEPINDYSVMIAETAALTVYIQAKNYILMNKKKEQFIADNLESIVNSLALSGIAMEIAGSSRPASGGEHLISHSIDELFGNLKPHGIQVAFGTYITSIIRYKLGHVSKNFVEELRAVLRYFELPFTLSGIGLTKDKLIQAIIHAPNTRPNKYTVLNEIKLEKQNLEDLLDILFGPNQVSIEK